MDYSDDGSKDSTRTKKSIGQRLWDSGPDLGIDKRAERIQIRDELFDTYLEKLDSASATQQQQASATSATLIDTDDETPTFAQTERVHAKAEFDKEYARVNGNTEIMDRWISKAIEYQKTGHVDPEMPYKMATGYMKAMKAMENSGINDEFQKLIANSYAKTIDNGITINPKMGQGKAETYTLAVLTALPKGTLRKTDVEAAIRVSDTKFEEEHKENSKLTPGKLMARPVAMQLGEDLGARYEQGADSFVKVTGKVVKGLSAGVLDEKVGQAVGTVLVGATTVVAAPTIAVGKAARANPKTAAALVAAGGLAATGAALGTSPVIAASAAVSGHAMAANVAATGAAAHASTLATGAAFQAAGGAVMGSIGAAGVGSGVGIPAVAVLMYANKNKLTRSIPAAYHALAYMTAAVYEGSAYVTNSMARFANHATREAKIYHQLHNEVNGAQLTLDRAIEEKCTKSELAAYHAAKGKFKEAIKDSLYGFSVNYLEHEQNIINSLPEAAFQHQAVLNSVQDLMGSAVELSHIVQDGMAKDLRLSNKSERLHNSKTGEIGKEKREEARTQMAEGDYRNFNTLMDSWGKFSTKTARSLYDRMAPVAQKAELELNRDAEDLQALYKRANRVNLTRAETAGRAKEESKSVKLFRANEGSMAEDYIPLSREEARILAESLKEQKSPLDIANLKPEQVGVIVNEFRTTENNLFAKEFAKGAAQGELTDLSREDVLAVYSHEAQHAQAGDSQEEKSIRDIILEDRVARARGIAGRAYDGLASVGRGIASVGRRGKGRDNDQEEISETDSQVLSTLPLKYEYLNKHLDETETITDSITLPNRTRIQAAWDYTLGRLTGQFSETEQGMEMKIAQQQKNFFTQIGKSARSPILHDDDILSNSSDGSVSSSATLTPKKRGRTSTNSAISTSPFENASSRQVTTPPLGGSKTPSEQQRGVANNF